MTDNSARRLASTREGRSTGRVVAGIAKVKHLRQRQHHEVHGDRATGGDTRPGRPCHDQEHRGGNQNSVARRPREEPPRHNPLTGITRGPSQNPRLGRFDRQRKGGSGIGHQVQPQDLDGLQRQRQAGCRRAEHDEDLGQIAAEEIEHELPDVVEDDAALLDGHTDRLEPIVLEHDRRSLACDVGASPTHRDADVGFLQRRGVVHAVADHGDDLAAALIGADDPQLGFGTDPAEHRRVRQPLAELLVGHRVHLPPIQRIGRIQSEIAGDRLRRPRLVAGHHHGRDASLAKRPDRRLDAGSRRIVDTDESDEHQVGEGGLLGRTHVAVCHGEHAQSARGHLLD